MQTPVYNGSRFVTKWVYFPNAPGEVNNRGCYFLNQAQDRFLQLAERTKVGSVSPQRGCVFGRVVY